MVSSTLFRVILRQRQNLIQQFHRHYSTRLPFPLAPRLSPRQSLLQPTSNINKFQTSTARPIISNHPSPSKLHDIHYRAFFWSKKAPPASYSYPVDRLIVHPKPSRLDIWFSGLMKIVGTLCVGVMLPACIYAVFRLVHSFYCGVSDIVSHQKGYDSNIDVITQNITQLTNLTMQLHKEVTTLKVEHARDMNKLLDVIQHQQELLNNLNQHKNKEQLDQDITAVN